MPVNPILEQYTKRWGKSVAGCFGSPDSGVFSLDKAVSLLSEKSNSSENPVSNAGTSAPTLLERYAAHAKRRERETRMDEKSWVLAEKAADDDDERRDEAYKKFHASVNMSAREVLSYAKSENGRKSGLSRGEAASQGIASGRDRPRQIAKLLGKPKQHWTSDDVSVAMRVVSFVARMKGASGPLKDDKGNLSRKTMSLLIWGHDPRKGSSSEKSVVPLTDGLEFDVQPMELSKAMSRAEWVDATLDEEWRNIIRDNKVDLSPYNRIIKVVPNTGGMDLQGQMIPLDFLRDPEDGIGFFMQYGNADVSHAANPTRKPEDQKAKTIASGLTWHETVGPLAYEVGRPIAGSFNPRDCSVLIYIYEDGMMLPPERQAALNAERKVGLTETSYDFFWRTLLAGMQWKASVGGLTTGMRPAMIDNGRGKQVIALSKSYKWSNLAMTPTPVDHNVPAVQIVRA